MATATKGSSTPAPKLNTIGLERSDYRGNPSTLCAGCGHDSISSQIMAAAWELSLQPHRIIKMSGIGCSSKSPAYFLNRSHGFNALHGRMPSVATGATTVNRSLLAIGVSGDGDTGSIGLGQFKHLLRRNVPMVYIIENNGVYGLTKGQFSATADMGQKLKYAGVNELPPIDLCLEALVADCGFVARSFAGDAKQVRELLKAAMSYEGTAVVDIISPCVTFNNHEESTKSYPYGKEHEERLHDLTFVPRREEISVEYEPGTIQEVQLHDGPVIQLRKLDAEHDPTDRAGALRLLETARAQQQFITGLIYINEARAPLPAMQRLPETPLVQLDETVLRPSREALSSVIAELS
ncbi:MAG: 2-oxoglutarate/2-oxoacid ferredoxin oxidoreductase, beta subunit [uncultured Chloroflexia bacterium]|uniref:2-oxoglutarate/2-oxoacid ferredoxin oxidoreductase, beta subunit n=1 Tax=uncultured Chloroflexia bacterium TaxID=1672391 RepID=A0A6J4IQA7_9CHLR|nr:MAG: 2-oxoglutarate/2-oxoacid ferredoxin oxidoreductase, beta subunit [uncultured Chloroflexia bacterium]